MPQNKSKAELTFFDYQNAFYSYWAPFKVDNGYYVENGIKKKAFGWKQFKRWEYDMEGQINTVTGEFPKQTAQEVYEKYLNSNPRLKSLNFANWASLGPTGSSSGEPNIGRINCIAFHPTDNNTYWVGTASGGLWVTTNNGSSWTCLTDNNGVLAISDIVIPTDFATSNTIYIATGDRDHYDNLSLGVLKSTNGGATWNTTGITYLLYDWKTVNRLLSDPANNQTLLAATSDGVYKTTNGGTTWNNQLTSAEFIDMEYKPGDFNTLYGSTRFGEIYVSSNGGASWTQCVNLPDQKRIELAVSANQPTWAYAVVMETYGGLYGIYKSINSGVSFTLIYDGSIQCQNLLGWSNCQVGGQGWYDLCLAVSPSNANTLLVGGINTWISTNGGTVWSQSAIQSVHVDKHMIKFREEGTLFECNDGGVNISSDMGTSWANISNGLVINQMYKTGVSSTLPNEIITGSQDCGTKLFSGNAWSDVFPWADGMECLIDDNDINVQYGSYQNGVLFRTTNHWATHAFIAPSGSGDGAWVTPYIIDPANNQTLFAGYADVWKTTNRGDSWTKISAMNSSDKIRSMAIAPSNNQYLYVADMSHIWKTANGGTSWTDITGNLQVFPYVNYDNITAIAVKNDDPNTVWVTLGNYSAIKVFQSNVGGTSWTNISAGLPSLPVYSIVQNKQSTTEVQLYVGTELGVYFKKGSDNWLPYNSGLPNVKIGEIEIYYAPNPHDSKVIAATYGRGLWESPVDYTCTPLPAPTINGPESACTGTTGTTYATETGMTGYTWVVSSGGTLTGGSGTNQITVTWNLAGAQTVSVNYYNSNLCTAASPTVKNVTVIPLPVPTIAGSSSLCVGTAGVNYTTEPDMTAYTWAVSSGATITGGSGTNQITITWNSAGAQTVSVNYYNSNLCTAVSPTVKNVTVNPLPVIPETPTGPDTVNLQVVLNSDYNTIPLVSASSYIWDLNPARAGIISGTGSTGTVVWNADFLGTALIGVRSVNSCGESLLSNEKQTVVENKPTGISQNQSLFTIIISPNPSSKILSVEYPAYSANLPTYLDFFETQGQLVKRVPVNGRKTQIDISALPVAVYLIKMTVGNDFRMIKFVKTPN